VLLVSRDREIVHEKAYGLARLQGEPAPMQTNTAFDLASVTKVMATTSAVMTLVDRGAIDLDASVAEYLPDFTGGGKDAITIRHLLTHRAGLYQWQPTYYDADDAGEAYAFIRDLPLSWPVGAERHYSDLGFMLLGRIVEQVSGRALDEFVSGEIYEPLGLVDTGYRRRRTVSAEPLEPGAIAATSRGNPFERRMVHDPDFGYAIEGDPDRWDSWRTDWLEGEVNDGNAFHAFQGVAGHAGLFSTARDLHVLLRILLDGGQADGFRLAAEQVVRAFLAPTVDGQALGWQLPDYAPAGSFGHTGFTGTFVLGVPAQDLAIVLLTNRQNFGVDENTEYPDVGPMQRAVTEALTAALGETPN
jgi:CubicO group peptidase (beta-lactamase class C family)